MRLRRWLGTLGVLLAMLAPAGAPPAAAQEPAASLGVTVSHVPEPAEVGSDLRYVVEVRNEGTGAATDVTVDFPLPAGWVAGPADSMCSEAGGTVSCSVGTMDQGTSVGLNLVLGSTTAGSVQTIATASSPDDADGAEGSDTATVSGQDCTWVGTYGDDSYPADGQDNSGSDVLCALGGDDLLVAGTGDDMVYGGEGADTVSYATATGPVSADLETGEVSGEGWTHTLSGVENVIGSPFDDVIRGSDGPNVLAGGGGTDLLFGRAGADSLMGDGGGDYLDGGADADVLDGGPKVDTCAGTDDTVSSCNLDSPEDRDDTRGRLDVRQVQTAFGADEALWRFLTFPRSTVKRLWDDGYVLVYLDTQGTPAADYEVLVRSTGRQMRGHLARLADGRRWAVTATHPNRRTVGLTVPMSRISLGEERAFWRWRAVTTFSLGRCRAAVCLDRVPHGGWMIQPRSDA